jgi:hypothetical protein
VKKIKKAFKDSRNFLKRRELMTAAYNILPDDTKQNCLYFFGDKVIMFFEMSRVLKTGCGPEGFI